MIATTPILDNFNRANGALGANWARGYGNLLGQFAVSSNRMVISTQASGYTQAYWSAAQFGPNCEVYFDVLALGATSRVAATIRHGNPDSTSDTYGYTASWRRTDNTCTIKHLTGGSSVDIQAFPCTLSNGDSVGFQAIDSALIAWHKPVSSGVWQITGTVYNTLYKAAGYILLYAQGDTALIVDNFGGGTLGLPARELRGGLAGQRARSLKGLRG